MGLLDYIKQAGGLLGDAYDSSVNRASGLIGDAANYRQSLAQMLDPKWQAQMRQPQNMARFDKQAQGMGMDMALTFAGPMAKTADLAKLKIAEQMKAQGVPDAQIHKDTGWFFGMADGKPRFEIPDNAAKWQQNLPFMKRVEPMSSVIGHDELYKAYPETGDITTVFGQNVNAEGGVGSYHFDPSKNRGIINIESGGSNAIQNAKETGLHEIQHAIQQREGWARGGSPEQMPTLLEELARQKYDEASKYAHEAYSGDPLNLSDLRRPGQLKKGLQAGKQAQDYKSEAERIRNFPELGFDRYKMLAGEAEARLTQSRMNMTPEQRAASYPPSMFDVPVDQQIVRGLLR